MSTIRNVAIIGASGNFGTPITKALSTSNFNITIITRSSSTTLHPPGIPIKRVDYDPPSLTKAFANQDAIICVVGPGGIPLQKTFIDAALAAEVKRFIIDDFGWGPDANGFDEFAAIHKQRREGWDYAAEKAREHRDFTWTGLTTGNPIDWAMKKFPMMGFDIAKQEAIIYDDGTERFTGTTLEGIGQAVIGVLEHPEETANRFCKVQSIQTCQNELLQALEKATGKKWKITKTTSKELIKSGKKECEAGGGMWRLMLAVATLYDIGEGRGMVAASRQDSDAALLGVKDESAEDIVAKLLRQ
ncbi:NAD(P)-binding protein [Aureobasidium subglaciale]|nr:NAD(P)-binding protein [Aureobasidium subglaciale]